MSAATCQSRVASVGIVLTAAIALAGAGFAQEKTSSPPVQVTIKDEQVVIVEAVLPIDPVRRIVYQAQPGSLGVAVRGPNNETLHLSHFPSLSINGQFYQQAQVAGAKIDYDSRPLPKTKAGKVREGFTSSYIFRDDLRITLTVTLIPTKPQAKETKRRMDAVLVHYLIENQGKKPQTVGLRIYMDTYVIDNDGCLFAAPTIPGKILDGVVLKEKELPPYVQLLQRPDLKNPGFVAHLTLDLGSKLEKPSKVVLTRHGTGGAWDMPAMVAGGDSALGVYWEPKEIKPGGKREFAYGYGQGIATSPESEGLVEMALGGSFEPGKQFTVTAYVTDPVAGQTL
ncbi:MAG TPA: hypothetical protein VE988_05130, partial [Gemmataceae bacterium]|nr:hypothetical protein [Gemmataceae bacterium]